MKKYLMTAVAALSLGGLMTSCTKDTDLSGGTARSSQDVQKTYEEAFLNTFGRPVEGLDWGFGIANNSTVANTRAITRANSIGELTDVNKTMPEEPTFRDGEEGVPPITDIKMPTKYKNTLADAGAKYAKEYQNYTKNDVIYINGEYSSLNNPQNTEGLTIYVDGKVTWGGNTKSGNNPTTFVVTTGSTFTLTSFDPGLIVYLAPSAILNLPNDVSFQNETSAIYMSENSQVNASKTLTIINGGKLLNAGGTITANNLTLDQESTLWNEGRITVTNTLTVTNTKSYLYNAGNKTITAGKIDLINNDCLIYNNGTVTATATGTGTGAIKFHNSNAEFINNGTLSGASLDMGAGGKMHNVGTTTITGASYITNSNSWWENDGQYTTGTFEVKNAKRVWNNCRLTAKTNFHLNTEGQFVLNGGQDYGASVVCENTFTFGDDADFWLGHKSLVSVANDLTVDHQDKGHGFRGPRSGDYAVITAANIKKSINPDYSMSYYGNLFIDTGSHFPQGDKDHPYWVYEDNVKFSFMGDNFSVTIDADEKGCNPGYKKGTTPPGPGVDPDATEVMVVAEDLSTYIGSNGKELADFDFNDVVFAVTKGNNGKVHIKLLAAGGTLPLTVGDPTTDLQRPTMEMQKDSQGNDMEEVLKYEVHRLFKVSTGTMVNTNSTTNGATRDSVEFDIDYPEGVSPSNNIYEIANAIPIRVYREDLSSDTNKKKWIVIPKAQPVTSDFGSTITASKLCVDTDFRWCNERNHIDTKFRYIDSYGNNKGSRFRLYLNGKLRGKWWKDDTRISGDN
jgi:hypothetical protein